MKKLALILSAISLTGSFSATSAAAGPFGLSVGEPLSDLNVLKHNTDNSYQVSVPAPNREFQSYSVFTTNGGAICDVVAVSRNEGNRLLAAYASVKEELSREYGKPTSDLDFCNDASHGSSYCFLGSNASPFNVPLELRMNRLMLGATWSDPGLADRFQRISLRPQADSFHDAHLIVSFKGKNAAECSIDGLGAAREE